MADERFDASYALKDALKQAADNEPDLMDVPAPGEKGFRAASIGMQFDGAFWVSKGLSISEINFLNSN